MGTRQKYLTKAIIMSTHNIGFHGAILSAGVTAYSDKYLLCTVSNNTVNG